MCRVEGQCCRTRFSHDPKALTNGTMNALVTQRLHSCGWAAGQLKPCFSMWREIFVLYWLVLANPNTQRLAFFVWVRQMDLYRAFGNTSVSCAFSEWQLYLGESMAEGSVCSGFSRQDDMMKFRQSDAADESSLFLLPLLNSRHSLDDCGLPS